MNSENEKKSKLGLIVLILDLFLICAALFVAYGRNPIVYAAELENDGVIYTPSTTSSNPYLFTYTGSDYNISVMPMVNQITTLNTTGNKTTPILSNNTLNYTEMYIGASSGQRVGFATTRRRFEEIELRKIYNLNYFSNQSPNYYGSYFSSRWLYNDQDDYDPVNNSCIFNHIRINIYSNTERYTLFDFDGQTPSDLGDSFDFNIYLMVLIKNEMLYTNVTGSVSQSVFTDIYPNSAFGIDSDGVIKTNIPFATYNGSDCGFSDYLQNGLTIDIYFKQWLGYSQYNNLVGILTNFYMDDYPGGDPLIYINTTLDYVPTTFNWDTDAYQNGYNDGVNSVDTDSYYDSGYSAGYSYGHDKGYDDGYTYGYDVGLTESSHDFGFKDLLFVVANTPITLLMNALSFNVFGVNVWAFIATLLTSVLVIWIVRKMLGSDS